MNKALADSLTLNGTTYKSHELKKLAEFAVSKTDTPAWSRELFIFILEWLNDSEYILQESSGTTGRKKKIPLAKKSMQLSAGMTLRYFGLRAGQTSLLCLPASYIAGRMMLIRSMLGGLNLYLAEPSLAPDAASFPPVDFSAMVPAQVIHLLNDSNDQLSIRTLLIGGAEIPDDLVRRAENLPGSVYATFGMAETCSHVALRKLNRPGEGKEYRALPGVELSTDDRNCLVIRAPWLNEPVNTNDLADCAAPGSFVWLGRYDNLINSGGVKVVPEEIESRIKAETGLNTIVVGLPHPILGQKVILVMLKEDQLTGESIVKPVLDTLPAPQQPKEIRFVDRFPLNRSYKTDRQTLVAKLRGLPEF